MKERRDAWLLKKQAQADAGKVPARKVETILEVSNEEDEDDSSAEQEGEENVLENSSSQGSTDQSR